MALSDVQEAIVITDLGLWGGAIISYASFVAACSRLFVWRRTILLMSFLGGIPACVLFVLDWDYIGWDYFKLDDVVVWSPVPVSLMSACICLIRHRGRSASVAPPSQDPQ